MIVENIVINENNPLENEEQQDITPKDKIKGDE